jgi:hypothetical protein
MINVRGWWVLGVVAFVLIGLAVNMSATTIHADVCPPEPASPPNGVSPPAKVCEDPTEEPTAEPTEEPTAEPTAVPGVMSFVGTFTESGGCGPGDVVFTVSPDGSEIVSVGVTNLAVGGNPIPDMTLDFDPGIPIDPDDGSFSNSGPLPPPLDTINAVIEGTFDFSTDPATVTGTLTASTDAAVLCDATAFSAESTDEEPIAPPDDGSGPGAGSSNEALLLTLLAAGLGAVALGATGMAVVRRRDA